MNQIQKSHPPHTTELNTLRQRVAELEQEFAHQHKNTKTLEENAERFRALFEASPSAITAIQDGRFVIANPVAARMLGYESPQEVIGLLALDCVSPATRELSLKRMERLSSGKDNPPAQMELLRKDGSTLQVESSMVPITLEGKPAGMMIATDITERIRTEQALRESEERHRQLVDNAPVGILSMDTQGQITAVNPALIEILGSPSAEATKAVNILTFPPLIEAGIVAKFRHCLETGDSIVAESPYTTKWKKQTFLRYHLEAIHDDAGAITGVQAMVEDITEQKQAEQEKEILGAISQLFLASEKLSDVYAGLPRILASLFQFPIVAVELYDDANDEMVLVGSAGLDIETIPLHTPAGQTLSGSALGNGQLVKSCTGQWLGKSLAEWGIQTFLCVPLQTSEKAIGAISIADQQERPVTISTLNALDIVAHRLYQEIDRKQTADALHYYSKRLEILREIDQAILAAKSPTEIAQAALARLRTIVPSRRASIVGYDLEANQGTVLAAHVEGETRLGIGAHVDLGQPESNNDPAVAIVMVNDIAAQDEIPPSSQSMLDEGVRSYLFVPLWVQNELIGSLNIGSAEVGAFAPEHVELAQQVANSLAIAIQNARLYERTQKEISERRTAEAAHRASERRHRNLIETMNDGLVTVDKEERITFTNDRFCEMLGYAQNEIVGRHIHHFHDQDNQAIIDEQWDRRQQGDRAPYELIFIRRNGESLHAMLSPRPILDDQGQFNGSISVITDITALKRAEQERSLLLGQIREQAQQMQQIIHTVPEGVILLDSLNQIILANAMAKEILPILAHQDGDCLMHLAGRPISELLTPPQAGLWHQLELSEPAPQFFEVIARPIEYGSALEGQVLVIRDVTQERGIQQRVQQQERMAAVGQLAAGIAHDFNNILAVILLYSQLLSRTLECGPADHERLETIVEQSRRASELINQILDFSRSSMLERKLVSLEPILKEQVKLLRRTLPENIEIELISGGDEYTVDADLTRIQQVVMNLAVNARDAMPSGGVLQVDLSRTKADQSIQCMVCGEVKSGEWARLTVSDNGTGIESKVIPHIFEPFFTTKEPGQGSGLGLAQVYGIVMQHDGHINVVTAPQQGTSFSIYLPAVPSDKPADTFETPAAVLEGQGQTILVVEDETAVRKALVNILEQLNFQSLEAENGRQARQIYQQHHPDIALVLTDLVMPGMGGLNLCQELLQIDPDVLVILLTGYPLEKDSQELRSMGVADWLRKPVSLSDLSHSIARTLHQD